jgi:hypothetical protein
MAKSEINRISRMISEDVNETLISVPGFGQMTKQQALNSTIQYLRQMAEKLEQGAGIPLHYFDLAKVHYEAAIGEVQEHEQPEDDQEDLWDKRDRFYG